MRTKTFQSRAWWFLRWIAKGLKVSLSVALIVVGVVLSAKWWQAVIKRRVFQLPYWQLSLLASPKTDRMLRKTFPLIPIFFGSCDLLIRFQVPLAFNNGCRVDPEKFRQLECLLVQRFGGWTSFDYVKGGWLFEERHYRDEHKCYEVLVKQEAFSMQECLRMQAILTQNFEQIEIFMLASPTLRL